jgi:hypothetical protein
MRYVGHDGRRDIWLLGHVKHHTTPQRSSVAFLAEKKTSPFFSEETSHA